MTWAALFDRATTYDVTVAEVREALAARRAGERSESSEMASGDEGSANREDEGSESSEMASGDEGAANRDEDA